MLEDGTVIVDEEPETDDRMKAEDQAEGLRLIARKTEVSTECEGETPLKDPVIEPTLGIRRRDTIPKDVPVEISDLNSWIKSMEEEHLKTAGELQPFIKINEKLQSIPSIPPNTDDIKRNISKMVRHFEERAAFKMPELVQMMTTEVDSDADKAGAFKWGFQVIVARNQANLQLIVFALSLAIIIIYAHVSPAPYQNLWSIFHRTFCVPVDRSRFHFPLFIVRFITSRLAARSWLFYSDFIVWAARRFAAPNGAWEQAMKKPAGRSLSQGARSRIHAAILIVTFLSCSRWSAFFETYLERALSFIWLIFFYVMVVSSLWSAKDWFGLHENASLRAYRLGAVLSVISFSCAVWSSLQTKSTLE
jgi:hypothetical protein